SEFVITLGPTFSPTPLDREVLTFDVAEFPKTLEQRLPGTCRLGRCARTAGEHTDPPHFPGLLPGGRERREHESESENNREPDQPHGHLGEGWLARGLAGRHDAHQHGEHPASWSAKASP